MSNETLLELVERVQGNVRPADPAAVLGIPVPPLSWTLERVIKGHVLLCLSHFQGDVQKSAAALGVGKTTLYRWLHTWDIVVRR
jgi:transcriptional regulator of acetoin/glycerol metabolism